MAIIMKTTGVTTKNGKTWGQGYIIYTPDKNEIEPSVLKNGLPFNPIKKGWDWINIEGDEKQKWYIIGEAHFFKTKGKKIAITIVALTEKESKGCVITYHKNGYPSCIIISENQLADLLEGKKTFQQICNACADPDFFCSMLLYFYYSIVAAALIMAIGAVSFLTCSCAWMLQYICNVLCN